MTIHRTIRPALALLVAAVLAVSATVLAAGPTSAGAGDEQRFIQLINQTRAAAGLPALSVHPELTAQARAWASSMAANDQLAHSADISVGITAPWTVLGENVGVHGIRDVDQLHGAFVASPGHYANLVDDRYRYVGVGVVVTESGKLWTTHRFMATAEPATTPPTTSPQTTTGPTSSPTTTQPPTTSPTTIPAPTTPVPTTASPATAPTTGPSNSAPPGTSPAEADATGPGTTATTATTSRVRADDGDELAPGPVAGDDGEFEVVAPPVGPGPDDVDTVERLLDDLVVAGI